MPSKRRANENSPVVLAVPVRVIPSSGLMSLTVAFGTLAPDGSVTVPDSDAVVLLDCEWRFEGIVSAMAMTTINTAERTNLDLVTLPPEVFSSGLGCFLAQGPTREELEPLSEAASPGQIGAFKPARPDLHNSQERTPPADESKRAVWY